MSCDEDSSTAQRYRLVDELLRLGYLQKPQVREAFLRVPREVFLPEVAEEHGLERVYRNEAFPAKIDAAGRWLSSSSEPGVMAAMLEALELQGGENILEVGTGTGYTAALLATIAGNAGRVTSIDISPDLVNRAETALSAAGVEVEVVSGDGRHGWPVRAPYDRMILTAGSPVVERAWLEQLRDGGIVVVPIDDFMIAALQRVGEHLEMTRLVPGGFMPLRGSPDVFPTRRPSPQVVASENVDKHRLYAWLAGTGMTRLPAASRRRLLLVVLETARPNRRSLPSSERRAFAPDSVVPLDVFLSMALREPEVVTIVRDRVNGAGIASRDGCSLAVVCKRRDLPGQRPTGDRRRSRLWLDVYGTSDAEVKLESLIEAWRRLGPPTFSRLTMRVDLGAPPERRSWRRWQRGDCWFSFDWVQGGEYRRARYARMPHIEPRDGSRRRSAVQGRSL